MNGTVRFEGVMFEGLPFEPGTAWSDLSLELAVRRRLGVLRRLRAKAGIEDVEVTDTLVKHVVLCIVHGCPGCDRPGVACRDGNSDSCSVREIMER